MATRSKRRLSAEERRTRTLERVTRVFAKKGFDGTTSADLARAAGISEAMLYKLFGSKEKLYQAMVEHKLTSDDGWGELPLDFDQEPEPFFTTLAAAVFSRVEADPDFVRLLQYSELQGGRFAQLFHEALGAQVIAAVTGYVGACVAEGRLRDDLDPGMAAMSFLCLCWQFAVATKVFNTEQRDLPLLPDAQAIEHLVRLFLDGVAA